MQNLNHLVSLLQEGYTTIGVIFAADHPSYHESKSDEVPPWNGQPQARSAMPQVYTYKCHFECVPGDLVILPPHQNNKLPSIGTVVRIDEEPELNFEAGIEYKWAVGRVDMKAYTDILAREKDLIKMLRDSEKRSQREKLLQSYQLSLPDDPESRKIFDQARQIGPTSKDD